MKWTQSANPAAGKSRHLLRVWVQRRQVVFQVGDGALELQLQELVLYCSERKKYNPCTAYFSFGSISRRGNTFTGDDFGEKKIPELPGLSPYFRDDLGIRWEKQAMAVKTNLMLLSFKRLIFLTKGWLDVIWVSRYLSRGKISNNWEAFYPFWQECHVPHVPGVYLLSQQLLFFFFLFFCCPCRHLPKPLLLRCFLWYVFYSLELQGVNCFRKVIWRNGQREQII